jgi:protein involved in polysaccharide export with SLBB domain
MRTLPDYVIEPPDILMINVTGNSPDVISSVSGKHMVGPDGTVNLGTCGQVYVAGMTIEEARDAITKAIAPKIESPRVLVDMFS